MVSVCVFSRRRYYTAPFSIDAGTVILKATSIRAPICRPFASRRRCSFSTSTSTSPGGMPGMFRLPPAAFPSKREWCPRSTLSCGRSANSGRKSFSNRIGFPCSRRHASCCSKAFDSEDAGHPLSAVLKVQYRPRYPLFLRFLSA